MKRLLGLFAVCLGCMIALIFIDKNTPRGPELSAPEILTVERGQSGDTVRFPFVLKNTGDKKLEVGAFSSSCTCTTSSINNSDGNPVVLKPGETYEGFIQVIIRENPGTTSINVVRFVTNDPKVPEATITVVVKTIYGLFAVPKELTITRIGSGEIKGKFEIVGVGLKNPKISSLSVLPSVGANIEKFTHPAGSTFKSTVNFSLNGNVGQKQYLTANVQVESNGDISTVEVPISVEFKKAVRVVPERIILPTISDTGPIFEGKFLIVTESIAESVIPLEVPDYCSIESTIDKPLSNLVTQIVKINPSRLPSNLPVTIKIGWKVVTSGNTNTVYSELQIEKP
jgi:hypothetical protein